ncbi:MAG: class I SAM-dependent methyltransferase, partial [Euryarchaeota archaeon]
MNRMWDSLIRPIIEEIEAKYIVEIGSESGINTKNILDYCEANDARMTAIDPLPGFDVDEFKNKYGDKFEFYQELSLSRLPLLKDYDVILIDGDHNWYTVYNELKIIEKTFKDKEFPLVFLHDVGWPYGRRDLYYNPENIPEAFRQPYKQLGMYPGQTDLKKEGGLNYFLYNSIYENNPHNGVLTAIEDFMEESDLEFSFEIVNVYHGFGILFHENNEIKNIVEEMLKSADLLDKLEEQRLNLIIENSELNKNMERLENLLNKIKIDKIEVETELKELENNNQLLRKRLKDLETEKNYIEKTFKESENTNKSLKKHLNQLEEEKNYIEKTFKESEN